MHDTASIGHVSLIGPHSLCPPPLQRECCQQAGGADWLCGYAELASQHGIISLDFFEHGGRQWGGLAGCPEDASSSGVAGSGDAAGPAPGPAPPQRQRLQKMLSIVREASEEGLEEGPSQETPLQLATLEEEDEDSCSWEPSAGAASSRQPSEEREAEGCLGEEGGAHAAAATAAAATASEPSGSSAADGFLERVGELLAAAAAAGLVPRPGSGCHLTCGGGSGSAALLHLDPVPFAIRQGARCSVEGGCCQALAI